MTLSAALAKATAVAADDISGERMAALGAVEVGQDSSPAAVVVEDGTVVGALLQYPSVSGSWGRFGVCLVLAG